MANGSDGDGAQVVFAWGAGEDGQLGFAEAPSNVDEWHVAAPTPLPGLRGTSFRTDVACGLTPLVGGSRQSLCVTAAGQLLTWGWNDKQALGLGHTAETKVPQRVSALPEVHVVQACWGGWHGLAVTDTCEAYAWGGNENLQTGVTDAASPYVTLPARILPSLRVRQVAAGAMHSLALTDSGDVWGWGQPLTSWGSSADTNVYARQRQPVRVEGAANVVRVAAGAFHNLALTATGHVLAWGNSDYGQLGLGSTTHVATPHVIEELSKAGVTALSAGGWHSGVLTAGGLVYIWGRGEHGRLGLGESWRDRLRPVELPLEARAAALSCGGTHTMVLTEHGELLSFGRQSFGRLGRGHGSNPNVPMPVELPPAPKGKQWRVEAVSAGGRHTLALARAVPLAEAGHLSAAEVAAAQEVLTGLTDAAPAALNAVHAARTSLNFASVASGGSPGKTGGDVATGTA